MSAAYADIVWDATPTTWKNTGGDKTMNLKNLANAGIREGAKSGSLIDGTKGMPTFLRIIAETKLQAAPGSAGSPTECPIYIAFSPNATAGTDNPGGLTGADASVSSADQLQNASYAGSIICVNAIGTGVQRQEEFIIRCKDEYIIPVFQNSSGQSTTNADGETIIRVWRGWIRQPVS